MRTLQLRGPVTLLDQRLTVLPRPPLAALSVLAATAATSAAQLLDPRLLDRLERTPAELHGQPWRILTALFVQDGGVLGTLSNLTFLLVLGAAAGQVLTGRRLVVQYFAVGALSEMIGYWWQPVGGGNSVAVCGLAGTVAVTLWRGDERLSPFAESALLLWCAVLLGTISSRWYLVAIVCGALAVRGTAQLRARGLRTARGAAVVALVSTIVLVSQHNIHGGALAAGLMLGLPLGPRPWHAPTEGSDEAKNELGRAR